MSDILRAFDAEQEAAVLQELITLTRMLSTAGIAKLEEDHWSTIYCKVKGIPKPGWSNLLFHDINHAGLGIESKLLRRRNPFDDVGNSLMHPAATRRIEFDPSRPAEECKDEILTQWGTHIREFEERVRQTSSNGAADIRWGVLLWGTDLRRFLYFEERIVVPNPAEYVADWSTGTHRGEARKNLHIFEKTSGRKRFSVTLPTKGAKLQPYFDVPSAEQGAHLFSVPDDDLVPIWVPRGLHHKIMDAVERYYGSEKLAHPPDFLLEEEASDLDEGL